MSSFYFICCNISSLILSDDNALKHLRHSIQNDDIDWPEVIALASGWLVLPALYDNLEKHRLWDNISEDVYIYLKTVHELSQERTVTTQQEIKRIHSYFLAENIPAVAIKGAAYHVCGLYSGTTFRIESDIDVLIPDNYLSLSYSLLEKNGFSCPEEQLQQWENAPMSHHLPPLLDANGIEVEIHQAPYPPSRIPILLTSSEVWDQAIPHSNLPSSPSPTHMMMLLLIHSLVIDVNYCSHQINLRIAQDTLLIRSQYEHEIDWQFIHKRFSAYYLQHLPAAYFHAMEYYFSSPPPKIFKKTWRTALFIKRLRLSYFLRKRTPKLHAILLPIKMRVCREKNVIGKTIREYLVRIKNKTKPY